MDVYLHSAILLKILKIILTVLSALLINLLVRSSIPIPRKIDTRRGRTYLSIVRSAVSIIIFTIALDIIFIILGIDITVLLASAGVVGIAIGIGARSLIEDIIAGLFLLTQATIAIGDYIKIGDEEGTIESIGFRTITIRSVNGALIVIPNGQVKHVVNYSWGSATLFIDIPVKAGQNTDNILSMLNAVLTEMKEDKDVEHPIREDSRVLGVQNIQVGNCILIRILIITLNTGREIVERTYRYKVIKSFEKNKISFA